MTDSISRKVNWAHSVLNDPGSDQRLKMRAGAVIRKYDPEGLEDHKEPSSFDGKTWE